VLARYGELQGQFEAGGGYTYEQRIKTVLHGLGFSPADYDTPLSRLSGGQKTRAVLARLLLENPDLLALDEPTNHLDIHAVEWLEGFLREYEGAVLVISHDRYFMDAMARTIWELDFGTLEAYRGSYTHYTEQRAARRERLFKEYEAQQEFIARETEYIRRNLAGQNTRQAQGRRTRLERLKRDGLVGKPRTRSSMALRMGHTVRSGDLVLRTFDLEVGYPGKPLFRAPNLVLRRGDVAALIGANGVGKSTFIKTILGDLAPLAGEARLGAAVQVGYFAQAHEGLNPHATILDEILAAKEQPISQARNLLGQFMFSGDDVFRPIGSLSGGERGRVALAKLALTGANLLMLDEPTNHLDIDSQEILQNVLADFPGTILLVSHDRYLIDALATHIWHVRPGEMTVFEGGYQAYLEAQAAREQAAHPPVAHGAPGGQKAKAGNGAHPSGLNDYQRRRKLGDIEASIARLEGDLARITAELEAASARGDAATAAQLGAAYAEAEAALNAALEQWAVLAD
jgi:ATP-binding cassette subfamily F protein 3